jgi:hypothetical protein
MLPGRFSCRWQCPRERGTSWSRPSTTRGLSRDIPFPKSGIRSITARKTLDNLGCEHATALCPWRAVRPRVLNAKASHIGGPWASIASVRFRTGNFVSTSQLAESRFHMTSKPRVAPGGCISRLLLGVFTDDEMEDDPLNEPSPFFLRAAAPPCRSTQPPRWPSSWPSRCQVRPFRVVLLLLQLPLPGRTSNPRKNKTRQLSMEPKEATEDSTR